MTTALMISAGGTTTVQAKGNRDRGFRSEANEKKNSDKRAHTRRDQGSRGSQARGGFRGSRGLMASRGHRGSGGLKGQHARSSQKGRPRGNKVRRDGQGRPGSNAKARDGKRGGDKNRGGGKGRLKNCGQRL